VVQANPYLATGNIDAQGGPGTSNNQTRNYYYQFQGSHPRRNDTLRVDYNVTSRHACLVRVRRRGVTQEALVPPVAMLARRKSSSGVMEGTCPRGGRAISIQPDSQRRKASWLSGARCPSRGDAGTRASAGS
jgi:hypothetical protein